MPEPEDERSVIEYAPASRGRRPMSVGEFGCALVAILYGVPLLAIMIFAVCAYLERD